MNLKIPFFICFLIINITILDTVCNAQTTENTVDYTRIPQKKVRKLLRNMYLLGIKDLSEVNLKCYLSEDSAKYCVQTDSHIIKENINNVWNKMMKLNLWDEFNGRLVSMGIIYSKRLNRIFYKEDNLIGIEEGQIFCLNLKLMGGIKNLGVGLEVTSIDKENKSIKFCYLNHGVSEGTQEIKFTETAEGYSIITHETRYHSESKFRDKRLYPGFHHKFVKELQENLIKMIIG
ncbi:MAG: hypothetical protein AUJ97_02460 [Bacteroidetes bacterium CG2_30_32_10]|nr:MAG: hypothetical protein AUJ97_02460 [Bacteroidetes bacterium CG2_30_32_10]